MQKLNGLQMMLRFSVVLLRGVDAESLALVSSIRILDCIDHVTFRELVCVRPIFPPCKIDSNIFNKRYELSRLHRAEPAPKDRQ